MNPEMMLRLALDHQNDLRRSRDEARPFELWRRANVSSQAPLRMTLAAPPSSVPCPTC